SPSPGRRPVLPLRKEIARHLARRNRQVSRGTAAATGGLAARGVAAGVRRRPRNGLRRFPPPGGSDSLLHARWRRQTDRRRRVFPQSAAKGRGGFFGRRTRGCRVVAQGFFSPRDCRARRGSSDPPVPVFQRLRALRDDIPGDPPPAQAGGPLRGRRLEAAQPVPALTRVAGVAVRFSDARSPRSARTDIFSPRRRRRAARSPPFLSRTRARPPAGRGSPRTSA